MNLCFYGVRAADRGRSFYSLEPISLLGAQGAKLQLRLSNVTALQATSCRILCDWQVNVD